MDKRKQHQPKQTNKQNNRKNQNRRKKKMGEFPSKFINKTNAKAIGRKGGLANTTLATKYAAQLREMKKKGDSDAQIKFFCDRLEDPQANVLYIQKLLDEFIAGNPRENNKVQAMEKLIQLHRANFGDKKQHLNVNVNLDLDVRDVDEHLRKVIGEENIGVKK